MVECCLIQKGWNKICSVPFHFLGKGDEEFSGNLPDLNITKAAKPCLKAYAWVNIFWKNIIQVTINSVRQKLLRVKEGVINRNSEDITCLETKVLKKSSKRQITKPD